MKFPNSAGRLQNNFDPSANGGAIGFHSNEFELKPVVGAYSV
jgi:hypothetical protein